MSLRCSGSVWVKFNFMGGLYSLRELSPLHLLSSGFFQRYFFVIVVRIWSTCCTRNVIVLSMCTGCDGGVDGRGGAVRSFRLGLVYSFFSGVRQRNPNDPRTALGTLDFMSNLASRSFVTSVNYKANNRAVMMTNRIPKQVAKVSLFPNFVSVFGHGTERLNLRSEMGKVINSVSTLPFNRRRLSVV